MILEYHILEVEIVACLLLTLFSYITFKCGSLY